MTDWKHMLNELLNDKNKPYRMNEWEESFVHLFNEHREEESWKPSGTQMDVLEKIWNEVFP